MSASPSPDDPETGSVSELGAALHSRGYIGLLLIASLLGIPISVIAFGFLAAVHGLEDVVWHDLPADLGFHEPPPWWPVLGLGLAGLLVALAVTRLPGHGGHVPATGLAAGATPPSYLPGVALAAAASLVLGAVVGPEAPLIAMGSGLAVLAVKWSKLPDRAIAVIAAAGSAAAIAAIFGNPLVAAVLLLEAVGLARRQAMLLLLPCLLSSGVGALVFTGLGDWTGFGIGALAIPDLDPVDLVAADLVWALPLAAVVAVATWAVFVLGRKTASLAASHTTAITVAAGLIAGCSAALYVLLTDHSATDVALSGQATLAELAADPTHWSAGALVLLLLCKGVAYALCIGAFRGGTVFPAIFLGAATGVLASTFVPGIEPTAGLAMGMAAGATVTRLPVTSILIVVLLLGATAIQLMPVIIIAAVTALVIDEALTSQSSKRTDAVEAASPADS
jgi:H+/Cl- antiporter ClcA